MSKHEKSRTKVRLFSWQECVVFSQTLDFDLLKMEREIAEMRQLLDEPETTSDEVEDSY